jgi:predicted metal-dependent phosphoesterase TrpH
MFLCDFHMHSRHSDGRLSISELVDHYGQRGFGAIAITDHLCETHTLLGKSAAYLDKTLQKNGFNKYLAEIEIESARAWHRYNMLLIPGVEITKNSFSHKDSAHILALGVRRYLDPNLSIETLLEVIRSQGGVSIAAHPVSTGKVEHQTYHLWHNRDRYSQLMDAWEVASGTQIFDEVFQSGLPMVANSDMHHLRQMTSWKTVMEGARTEENIFASIRSQNLSFRFYQDPVPAWSFPKVAPSLSQTSSPSQLIT